LTLLMLAVLSFYAAPLLRAQDDGQDVPLGDVARSYRKSLAPAETVIDNDNLSQVVNDAESRRFAGLASLFSFDASANSFHASAPDVTCSLSFSASTPSPLSDAAVLNDLPRSELAKLDGPANINGDSLQVTVHNGSSWEVREVVIGLTIVTNPPAEENALYYGKARVVPAVAGSSGGTQDPVQKLPDVTLLLRVKGSAPPSATATFRTPLNFALFPDQEWHWAIVKAKGIAPQVSADELTKSEIATQPPAALTNSVEPVSPMTSSSTLPSVSSSPSTPTAQKPQSSPAESLH
jgi:hypothetical protein